MNLGTQLFLRAVSPVARSQKKTAAKLAAQSTARKKAASSAVGARLKLPPGYKKGPVVNGRQTWINKAGKQVDASRSAARMSGSTRTKARVAAKARQRALEKSRKRPVITDDRSRNAAREAINAHRRNIDLLESQLARAQQRVNEAVLPGTTRKRAQTVNEIRKRIERSQAQIDDLNKALRVSR